MKYSSDIDQLIQTQRYIIKDNYDNMLLAINSIYTLLRQVEIYYQIHKNKHVHNFLLIMKSAQQLPLDFASWLI